MLMSPLTNQLVALYSVRSSSLVDWFWPEAILKKEEGTRLTRLGSHVVCLHWNLSQSKNHLLQFSVFLGEKIGFCCLKMAQKLLEDGLPSVIPPELYITEEDSAENWNKMLPRNHGMWFKLLT